MFGFILPIHKKKYFTIARNTHSEETSSDLFFSQSYFEKSIFDCFLAVPISQAFTLAANRKLDNVSLISSERGETFTNMSVFEFPPKEFCNR
jgi:hypothetical protein